MTYLVYLKKILAFILIFNIAACASSPKYSYRVQVPNDRILTEVHVHDFVVIEVAPLVYDRLKNVPGLRTSVHGPSWKIPPGADGWEPDNKTGHIIASMDREGFMDTDRRRVKYSEIKRLEREVYVYPAFGERIIEAGKTTLEFTVTVVAGLILLPVIIIGSFGLLKEKFKKGTEQGIQLVSYVEARTPTSESPVLDFFLA